MPRDIKLVEDTSVLPPEPSDGFHDAVEVINLEAAFAQSSNDNARAIATQLRYEGTLTIGALEDEIRFYQRRTVEGVLELGKRLLLLKELTPHGEFQDRVALLGIDGALARKFMSATLKFSKQETFPVFKVGSQSKLLELLVLDDGEISALEDGGTARGLKLDDIETMSVTELKKALRNARKDKEAIESVISRKDQKLNELDVELEKLRANKEAEPAPDMLGERELMLLQDVTRTITVKIQSHMRQAIIEAVKATQNSNGITPKHIDLAIAQSLGLIITASYQVADDYMIQPVLDTETAADDPAKADAEAFLKWNAQQSGE